MKKIKNAKSEIKIIQPYYYPMSKFERAVNQVLKRNKLVMEVITTGKRDQLAYKYLKN
jgi:hypothetical protein